MMGMKVAQSGTKTHMGSSGNEHHHYKLLLKTFTAQLCKLLQKTVIIGLKLQPGKLTHVKFKRS